MGIELSLGDIEASIPMIEVVGIDEKAVAYRIKKGDFENVAYTYANIRFNVVDVESGEILSEMAAEDVDPNDPRYALEAAFEYVILENPDNRDIDAEDFKKTIGAILIEVIELSIGVDD